VKILSQPIPSRIEVSVRNPYVLQLLHKVLDKRRLSGTGRARKFDNCQGFTSKSKSSYQLATRLSSRYSFCNAGRSLHNLGQSRDAEGEQ
jgi:hypothetical protein